MTTATEEAVVAQAPGTRQAAGNTPIRPFTYHATDAELNDLRRRIKATRWPEKETVADTSQGVPLAPLQDLARYWATDYDWRKCEAKLNALPQFITEIDGLDIHFIHVRSKHKGALPVIVTHGWPGSILEQIKLIGPLTDPTAFGGRAEDAFDVVIPSIPGYGFSGKPTATGWDHARIARAWIVLMKRLGYTRYVAQGGDVGGQITDAMAVEAPAELVAIHTNFLFALPAGRVERDSRPEHRRRPISPTWSDARSTSCRASSPRTRATRSRWRRVRRRSTDSPIRRSASRPG